MKSFRCHLSVSSDWNILLKAKRDGNSWKWTNKAQVINIKFNGFFVYDLGLVAFALVSDIPTAYFINVNWMRMHSIPVSIHYSIFFLLAAHSKPIFIFVRTKIELKRRIKKITVCMMAKCLLMTFAKLLSPHNKHTQTALPNIEVSAFYVTSLTKKCMHRIEYWRFTTNLCLFLNSI